MSARLWWRIARGGSLVASLATSACGGGSAPAPVKDATRARPEAPAPTRAEATSRTAQAVLVARGGEGGAAGRDPTARARAMALLREAIAIDDTAWEPHFDLGLLRAQEGDLAGAESELARAADHAKDAEQVAVALGEVRRRRGEHKAAANGLASFVTAHPEATAARSLYVASLRDAGDVDRAIAQGREVLVRHPGDATALGELALAYLGKGEKAAASLLAKQALDADPRSATAHRAAGLLALAEGDDAAAFAAFSRAAEEDPRDTTARSNMGAVLLRAGAYAKAAEQYRALLNVAPDDADAEVGLAVALRGMGTDRTERAERDEAPRGAKIEEAERLLQKVIERNPHHVAALYDLAVVEIELTKRPGEARDLLRRFLDEAPGDHPARADAEKYLASLADAKDVKEPKPEGKSAPSPAAPRKTGGGGGKPRKGGAP